MSFKTEWRWLSVACFGLLAVSVVFGTGGVSAAQSDDVSAVIEKIKSDPDAFKKFCGSSMEEMRAQVKAVIVAMATSGDLKTSNYGEIGSQAGRTLATQHCNG